MNRYDLLPIETCVKLRIADYYTLQFIYLGMMIENQRMYGNY
jgi:hypothetical protein